MSVLLGKLKEVSMAVAPVAVLVIILNFTLTPLPAALVVRFLIGATTIIIGISILLIGIDMGFMPFGSHMGTSFIKSNSIVYVVAIAFMLGFFINFAEPDLHVLAIQVSDAINNIGLKDVIRLTVAAGTGLMLMLGVVRIVRGYPIHIMFLAIYGAAFTMLIFADWLMVSIAFDASAAATGIITVPLVLALSVGVASGKRDSKSAENDSFGLVGIMASGAVVGVLAFSLFAGSGGDAVAQEAEPVVAAADAGFFEELTRPFHEATFGYGEGGARVPGSIEKTAIGLLPVIVLLFLFQKIKFRLRTRVFLRILVGFGYSFVGIILFFIGVNGGFMEVGQELGRRLADHGAPILVAFGCLLGMVGILTEPAVHVLSHQVQDVTNGYIKRRVVLVTLVVGVAMAAGLAMLRIVVPGIMLWHYLVPGFSIAAVMMFFVPKIFLGIAIDSGGVASGPMAATFVLAFARGAAEASYPELSAAAVATEAFGFIAMIAMTPLLAIQALGLIFKIKSRRREAGANQSAI